MRHATLYRYQLPMDSGVILRDEKLTQREGLIVELCENGRIARGEIAPLPGFSLETLAQAETQAQTLLELWVDRQTIDWDAQYPSVACGLSMAQYQLDQALPMQGNYHVAPLCTGDPDELLPVLNNLPGQKVAKVKVGLYEPIRDGMLVNLFLESMPDLTLRLDANRAWTPAKALKFAQYIAPSLRSRIAFLEEPCQSPSDSIAFAMDTGIAIAWDETLQQAVRDADFVLDDLLGAKTLVIKPTLIGSVYRVAALVTKANALGLQAVISSSLESSLGLNLLARLAQQLLPDQVPGLDTIGLFRAQLETPWPDSQLPVVALQDQAVVWRAQSTQ